MVSFLPPFPGRTFLTEQILEMPILEIVKRHQYFSLTWLLTVDFPHIFIQKHLILFWKSILWNIRNSEIKHLQKGFIHYFLSIPFQTSVVSFLAKRWTIIAKSYYIERGVLLYYGNNSWYLIIFPFAVELIAPTTYMAQTLSFSG